jgi:hypothetical protein
MGGRRIRTNYEFSPETMRLTHYETYGIGLNWNYNDHESPAVDTMQIQDINDLINPENSDHYEYDGWDRLLKKSISMHEA